MLTIRVTRGGESVGTLRYDPAATGSTVYSVGNSGLDENLLWRLTRGIVRGRNERRHTTSYGIRDCMVLETDAPTNGGDSGGAVVNDRGDLVAVVSYGHARDNLVSGNIDVEEVRKFVSPHLPER